MLMIVRFSGFHLREWIVCLTLFSHLMITLGFPLSSPGSSRLSSVEYPCQNGPCGCVSAELCWAGDCCCYTLEQKLAWADANGILAPAHVRPMVEARKKQGCLPSKKTCCEADLVSAHSHVNNCCDKPKPTSCCIDESTCSEPVEDCPECARHEAAAQPAKSLEKKSFRWVVGLFASKCRGEKPAGLFQLVASVIPDLPPVFTVPHVIARFAPPQSEPLPCLSHAPPSPPPRAI